MTPSKFLKPLSVVCMATALMSAPALAQTYPNKPIRLIVGFPPGGGTDLLGRVLAQQLSSRLATPVVVENVIGAGSSIAAGAAAKAAPDGYTILLATSSLAINPSLYKSVTYSLENFIPVARVGDSPFAVLVGPEGPQTLNELLSTAKTHPGKLNYSSGGNGSVGNISAELLKFTSGSKITHVPYKGTAPAVAALMGGYVDVSFADLAACLPFIRSGKVKALAVTTSERVRWLPEIPTAAEAGLPGYEVLLWNGLFLPAGTPDEVVSKVYAAITDMVSSPGPELIERYNQMGMIFPKVQPRAAFADFVKADFASWKKRIADSKVRLD